MDQSTFEQKLSEYGSDFVQWIQSQELTEREENIWLFQYWLRNETDLSSGYIVDCRKYVAEYLDQNGKLPENISQVSSHEQAALNKYTEFTKSTLYSKTSGDNSE